MNAKNISLPSYWPLILLTGAVFAVYANTYGNAFLFDDEFLIQKNTFLLSWDNIGKILITNSTAGMGGIDSFYRPIQGLLYLIIYQLFGLSTVAFHALNILIHAGNACLLFVLVQRLGFTRNAALLGALLWAVHPIHTEAVTYMSATADPLHAFFILAGLLVWNENSVRAKAGALLCFTLALLTKEAAIVFPALLVFCLFLKNEGKAPRTSYLKTWPVWIVAILYLIARATFLNLNDDYNLYKASNIYTDNFSVRVYTFLATLPDYFRLLIWPNDLHMERQALVYIDFFSWKVLAGTLILFLLPVSLFAYERWQNARMRQVLWGLGWFFAVFFPLSGVFVPMNALFLEHWLYLSSMGLFVVVGSLLTPLAEKPMAREILYAVGAIVIGACAVVTWQQNKIWKTPIDFYTHILKYEKGSPRVYTNIAMAYQDTGNEVLAVEHYLRAMAESDQYPQPHYNLALLLVKHGQIDMAIKDLKRALEIDPRFYRAKDALDQIYAQTGKKPEKPYKP